MVIEKKKVLPEVRINLYKKSNPLRGVVRKNIPLTEEEAATHHIVLEVKDYPFREGQSAGVLVPGESKVRLYSIANVGSDISKDTLELCVKRVIYIDPETGEKKKGVASNYLCDLKEGEEVLLTGPAGKMFLLPKEEYIHRPYIFLATGTGIAPFRGMIKRLLFYTPSFQEEVYLFFGVPYRRSLLYKEEWEEYQEKFSFFHFIPAISREEKTKEGKKMYVHERLKEHRGVLYLLKERGAFMYICGLKGMEEGIREVVEEVLGGGSWDSFKEQIFIEVY